MPKPKGVGMRKAIDTNVLVRLLARDDSDHFNRAAALLNKHLIFIGNTVLLETEWVLRSSFKYDAKLIGRLFEGLLKIPTVEFEDLVVSNRAVSGFIGGMDFADALHLFSAKDCDQLYSFDKDFARRAQSYPQAIEVIAP